MGENNSLKSITPAAFIQLWEGRPKKNPQVAGKTRTTHPSRVMTRDQFQISVFKKMLIYEGFRGEKAVLTTCALALTSVHWMYLI